MFRKMGAKSIATIASEWDALAHMRLRQISSGEDVTFNHILVPTVLRLARREVAKKIIDAGCGVGILTSLLVKQGTVVIGVDPSPASIAIARANFGNTADFFESTLEAYAKRNEGEADLVIANMVLMNVLDLAGFVAAAHRVVRPGGAIIFSIVHPCFWPSYSGYSRESWYQYDREIIIESAFRIAAEPDCNLASTHVHRPLEMYVQTFVDAPLLIEALHEPMPSPQINAMYPEPWAYPRHLFWVCRR